MDKNISQEEYEKKIKEYWTVPKFKEEEKELTKEEKAFIKSYFTLPK